MTDRIDVEFANGGDDDVKIFLESGENNDLQPTNETLTDAVPYGLYAVESLIKRFRLQPTIKTLNRAALNGDHELVLFLLRPHFNLQPTKTTLFNAMETGKLSIVKIIAENSNLQPTKNLFYVGECITSVNIINYIKDKYHLVSLPNMIHSSRLMLFCLFHPRENPVITIENATRSVSSCRALLDSISELAKTELMNLESLLIDARNTDPEFFYSYVDYFVETGQEIFGMDLINILSFPVIQESTYPHTQYAIVKAALEARIELPTEVVCSLIRKAMHGFNLLGDESFYDLAVEAVITLTSNSISMKGI